MGYGEVYRVYAVKYRYRRRGWREVRWTSRGRHVGRSDNPAVSCLDILCWVSYGHMSKSDLFGVGKT
jgi:hypothetical protein